MAVRPIDASRFGEILEQWKKDCLEDNDTQGADIISDVMLQLDDMPTLTPPNEPLTLISMSDEIPPDNERVLVYRPCMVDSDTGPYSVQWGWAAKRDGSHWARLPDRRPTAEEMEKLEGIE